MDGCRKNRVEDNFKSTFFPCFSFTPTNTANKTDLTLGEVNRQLSGSQLPYSEPQSPQNPSKRIRVTEMEMSRYNEEFVEVSKLSEGSYGVVTIAKHRLDGMLYAVKVRVIFLFASYKFDVNNSLDYFLQCTKRPLSGGPAENSAMNEVFALAALPKHKNLIRYYSSWVEKGKIYIQNEYCEGGSLAQLIQVRREKGTPFTENELKRMLTHLAKGMRYE